MKFLIFVANIFALFAFFSCADSTPEIADVRPSLVLEFDSEKSKSVSLSVFVKTESDSRRAESLFLKCGDEDLRWTVEKPSFLSGIDNFVYAKKICMQNGSAFPNGKYSVVYKDSCGNEVESEFSLNYDKKILTAALSEIPSMIENAAENIALYDEENKLIFFGKAKSSWTADSEILKENSTAKSKRRVVFSSENKIVCLFPVEKIVQNKEN